MQRNKKHKLSCKAWLEYNGKPLIGKGGAEILSAIDKERSISKAAEKSGMSYRYVWNYIQEVQQALKEPVVKTFKGGKDGGGGAELTELGKSLVEEYKAAEDYLSGVLSDRGKLEVKSLKLSARNQFKGKIVNIEKGVITAKVKVEVTVPVTITAVITKDAVEDLNLKVGDEVSAIVKSTEVMIAK
ncbi:MAG TPA: TOBE domain-containing protein [Candidatus Deferrimicrobiaceae bacterium]|jgi:molybdate transport system regulatory protein|nr:TOBE domain-containing protein [Candidatus Deferrimicrobiaceae bacterium]